MSHSYALRRLLNFLVELFRNEASEAGGLDLSDSRVEPKTKSKRLGWRGTRLSLKSTVSLVDHTRKTSAFHSTFTSAGIKERTALVYSAVWRNLILELAGFSFFFDELINVRKVCWINLTVHSVNMFLQFAIWYAWENKRVNSPIY